MVCRGFRGTQDFSVLQASVREIKRLDAISRSPVYGSIGEELAGLATIRAYRAEGRLITRNADLIDRSVIFSLVNQSMNRCVPGLPHAATGEADGMSNVPLS